MNAIELIAGIIKNPAGGGEGCKLTAYWDSAGGCWTIGWGHTGREVHNGLVWTQLQADAQLINDIGAALSQALSASPILKTQSENRQASIGDFVFNLGIGRYVGSTLKKLIDAGQWQQAATEILKWDHAGGKVLPGLQFRRKEESALLQS